MTTYARQYYLDLIKAQIEANSKDADELMVQRCYDVRYFSELVLNAVKASQSKDHAFHAQVLAYAIERAVFAAIEKSAGEMAEIEAMQTPDPEDFDDVQTDGNAMLDNMGARHV